VNYYYAMSPIDIGVLLVIALLVGLNGGFWFGYTRRQSDRDRAAKDRPSESALKECARCYLCPRRCIRGGIR